MELKITCIPAPNERLAYMELLKEADEQEMILQYLYKGELYVIRNESGKDIGVVLITYLGEGNVELKNLALAGWARGKGWGRLAVEALVQIYAEKGYRTMIVGTANSSIANLAFYQKAGFRMTEIRKGFFDSYPRRIIENGILARDMVMFARSLEQK